jgi:hypothetical protein
MKTMLTILLSAVTLLLGRIEPFPDRTTDPVRPFSDLEVVADLPWPPGNVAVTSNGRTFITFHPDGFPLVNVAEIINGTAEPYPSLAQEKQLFNSVLSLRIGPDDKTLWTLDHKQYGTLGRPRFLVLDLENGGQVLDEYTIPMKASPLLAFLNDFVFTPDGKGIVIGDFSAITQTPALITLDIETRTFARKLHGDVSVVDAGYDMYIQNSTTPYGAAAFYGVDPIAIAPSVNGRGTVYYGPLNGPVLYSISVDDLFNNDLNDYELAAKVNVVADKTMTDGIWFNNGLVYLSDMEHGAIVTLDVANNGELTTLFKDPHIRWPDGFSQAKNGGYIYFTCADLNHVSFNLGYLLHFGRDDPYQVYRFMP